MRSTVPSLALLLIVACTGREKPTETFTNTDDADTDADADTDTDSDSDTDADADTDADSDADADADSDADTDTETGTVVGAPADLVLPGELVITEILADSAAVADADGEWFEIVNVSGNARDLEGLVIRDAVGADSFTVAGSLPIAPGAFAVFGVNADPALNGGVTVAYEYSGFTLANSGDEVVLENAGGVLDEVAYSAGWPTQVGGSIALHSAATDPTLNDAPTNWCDATTPFGAGDNGTPGAVNPTCFPVLDTSDTGTVVVPAVPADDVQIGELVVTEVLQDPSASDDAEGEWFEILNLSGTAYDLDGLIVHDDGIDTFSVVGSLPIAAGGRLVFGVNGDPVVNGGVSVDYVYASTSLANGDDEIVLRNARGVVDRIAWDGGAVWPDPTGASMALDPASTTAASNDAGASWCEGTAPFGSGDLGSPGDPNASCSGVPVDTGTTGDTGVVPVGGGADDILPGQLVITEVLQDPSAVGDGNGEWFEVQNVSGAVLDLDGLVVRDLGNDSFTVSGALVLAAGARAVFGIDGDPLTNGGVSVDYVWSGFGLTNTDDEILLDNASGTIDQIAWDNGVTWPDPTGASMNLDPLATTAGANDLGTNWCEATAPFGAGDLGTPGAANGSCAADTSDTGVVPGIVGLVMNEILADPGAVGDSNCDGVVDPEDDEFLELVNTGPSPIDLSNATIGDLSGSGSHVFPAVFLLQPGDAVVIWGGGTAACAQQAGVTYQVASPAPGTLSLNNGGDTITVTDSVGVVLASHAWGAGDADNDQSIVLDPELDPTGTYIDHSTAAGAVGNSSPGTRVDGTAL